MLSKYTFLFEQSKENAAPDGTTNLQVSWRLYCITFFFNSWCVSFFFFALKPWIKKVLAEMQESVENHITSAMKNGH